MPLHGNIFDYIGVYLAGVVVSFTPCVYPLMPVVASFIAGFNTRGTRARGFIFSLFYVLGLAVTYSILGMVASLQGKVFGHLQNHPLTSAVAGVIFVFFGLVMLDVIPFLSAGFSVSEKIKKKNIGAIVLAGMTSGLIVGPCLTPVLGGLLVYAASKQNVVRGAGLLFVFSLGLGTSLVLVGTFSGFLGRLPKSGRWLIGIKRFCAVILLTVGSYLLIKAARSFF